MTKRAEKTTASLRHLAFLGSGPLGSKCHGRASFSIPRSAWSLPPACCRQLTPPSLLSLPVHLSLNLQTSSSQHPFPAGPRCFSSLSCSAGSPPVPPGATRRYGTDTGGGYHRGSGCRCTPVLLRDLILLIERPPLVRSAVCQSFRPYLRNVKWKMS